MAPSGEGEQKLEGWGGGQHPPVGRLVGRSVGTGGKEANGKKGDWSAAIVWENSPTAVNSQGTKEQH